MLYWRRLPPKVYFTWSVDHLGWCSLIGYILLNPDDSLPGQSLGRKLVKMLITTIITNSVGLGENLCVLLLILNIKRIGFLIIFFFPRVFITCPWYQNESLLHCFTRQWIWYTPLNCQSTWDLLTIPFCLCVLVYWDFTFHSLLNLVHYHHCVVQVTGVQLKVKLIQMIQKGRVTSS